jgi:ABC-type sugar transport system substrate-binding protein
LLDDGIEFNVILSINDAGSYGAIQALEEANIDPSAVLIFSIDAEQLAQRYITEGNFMRASLQVGRTATAQALVNSMVLMLAGKKVGEQIIIPPGAMVDQTMLANEP